MEPLEVLLGNEKCDQYVPQLQNRFNGKVNFKGAANGGQAAQEGESRCYDVVILDYNMSGNVFQAAIKITSKWYDIDKRINPVSIIGYHWKKEDASMLNLPLVTDSMKEIIKYIAGRVGIDESTLFPEEATKEAK
ncbi:MAG: hypothetical protein KKE20_00610 [Nanoarchaeota archaeon]|nr:hypothetical protein [Nanoarchaeota archaeon]